eukprot:Partr_v1_DN23595_c0_g2_i1_m14349 putative PITH (C-terminal proteasome-interacting domain of thioredoxin-like) domain containing 1
MSGHHHHHHDGCGHEATEGDHHHGHDHDSQERGMELSLFNQVAVDRVWALNESIADSCRSMFKNWENRPQMDPYLESDCDDQLIVHVPFNAIVKLKSIELRGDSRGSRSPRSMRVWINRQDVDFDLASTLTPTQEWDHLVEASAGGVIEYEVRMAKFNNVRSVTIFFDGNVGGGDVTRVEYLGFKGEWEELKQDPVITVYELNANPADHPKTKADSQTGNNMIQ